MPAKKKPSILEPKTVTIEFNKESIAELEPIIEEAGPMMALYDLIAIKWRGKKASRVESYDCQKLEVSKDIIDLLTELLEKRGYAPQEASLAVLFYGPKFDENLPKQTVRVEPGFVQKTPRK